MAKKINNIYSQPIDLVKSIDDIGQLKQIKQELAVQEYMLIEKGLKSDDPSVYINAAKAAQDIQQRETSPLKSYILDLNDDAASGYGFRDKQTAISFLTLRRMSRVPIIKALISTRVDQVASFAQPQADKYSTGFVIRKKSNGDHKEEIKDVDKHKAKIKYLTDFILNCGSVNNKWHGDDFDTFIRKFTADSLIFDQACMEVVRNRKGLPIEFIAVDASTIRVADSWDDTAYAKNSYINPQKEIKGYYPSFVQIYQGQIIAEYYPWELCMAVRNSTTDMLNTCYGQSELEDLIYIVTAILWADQYNMNFFKVGSAPKGIIKVANGINQDQIASFRQQWNQSMSGVQNSFKTPILEGDKAEFINLQQSSRDMEYAKFQDYLLKVCCALYKIDPSELGFNISGGSDAKTVFESNNEAKLTHSKDKGLRPLLKFIEAKINKFIITPLDPDYEFVFVGLDGESAAEELQADITMMSNFMTVNEIRKIRGLDLLDNCDYIANANYFQQQQMDLQKQQMAQQAQMDQQQSEGYDQDEEQSIE